MNFKIDSPFKRLGIIFMIIPVTVLIACAVVWHVQAGALLFFTQEASHTYIKAAEPPPEDGMTWVRSDDRHLWYKLDKKCTESGKYNFFAQFDDNPNPEVTCETTTVNDTRITEYYWKFSFWNFLNNVEKIVLVGSVFLFLFGMALLIAIPQRFLKYLLYLCTSIFKWIMTGEYPYKGKRLQLIRDIIFIIIFLIVLYIAVEYWSASSRPRQEFRF